MKMYIIIILIFTLLSCGIKKSGSKEVTSNKYELMILDSLIIQSEASFVCCNDSLIFISEKFDKRISCYDNKGRKINSFGGQGYGPGEFSDSPSCISIYNNFVVAADIPEFEIEIFNLDGSFLKNISYIEQMITPVSNIVANNSNLIIEGLSLNMKSDTAVLHKVITLDNELKIKEESVTILRKLVSFDDIFNNLNPFEMGRLYFSLNNRTAKIIYPDLLRIYCESDSADLSLQSIPLVKVNQNVIEFLSKSIKLPGFKLDFPDYLPKINNVFMLDDNILVLSEEQKLDNQMDSSINNIYLFEQKNNAFISLAVPLDIQVSKILLIYKSKIFLQYEDRIKIISCNFN